MSNSCSIDQKYFSVKCKIGNKILKNRIEKNKILKSEEGY